MKNKLLLLLKGGVLALLGFTILEASTIHDAWNTSVDELEEDVDYNAKAIKDAPEQYSIAAFLPCAGNPGDIGGTVFQDINNDGVNNTESGQEDMIVMVYDCDGNLVGNTTTDANGEWTVTGLTDGEQYRVEFTFPASLAYLQPGASGTDNGTDVQLVTPATCEVDFGVVDPDGYCQENPFMVTPCYINGSRTAGGPGEVLVSWPFNATGGPTTEQFSQYSNPQNVVLATKAQIGSTWGIAHQSSTNTLFMAAFLKRHVDLGPNGLGAIYKRPNATGAGTPSLFLDLATIPGVNVGTINEAGRGLGNTTSPSNDAEAFGKVGKVGFGDIEISEDGNTLYAISLADKKLYAIVIDADNDPSTAPTAADVTSFTIPDPGCVGGAWRPFALGFGPAGLYVGGVCDASSSSVTNSRAYAYVFDGTTFNTSPVINFSLDYNKGEATNLPNCRDLDWLPWTDSWPGTCSNSDAIIHPQPILSDLAFDDAGNMTLGFIDRMSHQGGHRNRPPSGTSLHRVFASGEILRATPAAGGNYTIESSLATADDEDEFYNSDRYNSHQENALGGLVQLGGSDILLSTVYDPTVVFSNGARMFNSVTGTVGTPTNYIDASYTVFASPGGTSTDPTTFGKAAGLGDLEAMCSSLPIEIGNYVWYDTDMDGVQDPCEPPVTNLPVTLIDKNTGNVVAVTTTDGTTGEYYFTETADGLEHDTPYAIVFGYDGNTPGNTVFAGGIFTIGGMTYELTGTDASTEGATDLNDSDASLMTQGALTDFPIIMYTTADSTDHTLDVGLSPVVSFDLALTKVEASSGPYSPGDPVTFTIEVFNQGNVDATDVVVSDYVPSDMTFDPALNVANDFAGSVDLMMPTATIASIPAGMSETVTIVLTIDPATLNSLIVNNAEITSFDDDNDPTTDPPVDEDSTPGDNQGDDETDTDNDIDDEFTGTPGTMDNPDDEDDYDPAQVMVTQPACDINITNVVVNCTNGTDFTVSFDVNWDNANATSDMIEVTVDGDAQAPFTPGAATGTQSFGPITVTGPAYGLLLEANFLTNTACGTATTVDLIACTPDCVDGAGTVGGNVFNDFNNDGADAGAEEVGQENVLVEVYDCDGVLVCSTYTNADGNWACDGLTDGEEYRVEFSTPLQPYLQPSFAGVDNGTNTQFTTAPSCAVDYGVIVANEYCEDNPLIIVPCYFSGPQDNDLPALVGVYYNEPDAANPTEFGLVNDTDIGTTYGVAYQAREGLIYASAMTRHFFDYGPGGFDAIYAIDFVDDNGAAAPNPVASTSQTINLSALGVNMGTTPRSTPLSGNAPYDDGDVYQSVGKIGIGDIDISADGDTLFVINLNEAAPSLVLLDISNPAAVSLISEIPIPDPGCVGGDFAPWGARYYNGELYIGGVCTAEASGDIANLEAYVYRYTGGTNFTEVLNVPLDYDRSAATYRSGNTFSNADWRPWTDAWNPDVLPLGGGDLISQPMPILQDIEFNDRGDMILGFGDRFTYQTAFGNRQPGTTTGDVFTPVGAGDILQVCYVNGVYVAEGNGSCPQPVLDLGSDNVPGIPDIMEYFDDNYINEFNVEAGHAETSLGGLTTVSGKGEILMVGFDPRRDQGNVNTSGIRFMNNDGTSGKGWEIVAENDPAANRKGGSLGDAEALCGPLPIQIGNYAWIDEDEDGIQDACEEPLPGLTVKLYRKDGANDPVQIASTLTDANGNYYFSSATATDPNLTWTGTGADTSLQSGQQYFVAFCGDNAFNDTDNTIEVDGVTYCLTTADTGEGNNPDLNDSDATVQDILGAMIPAYCTQPGEVDTTNHTFDVGWKPVITCDLQITAVTPVCTYNPADGQSTFAVTVNVAWDYAELATTNELINVTFADQTLTIDPASTAVGTGMIEFTGVAGPAYSQLVTAAFATTVSCSANAVVDLIACTPDCVDGPGTIGGNVFNDFNNDGADAGAGEVGQANVLVEVYDCDGVLVCSTYTNADGNWACDGLTDGEEYRVEFSTPLQPYLQPSFAGTDNGTNTQFTSAPSCAVDYGVVNAVDYCNDNVSIIAPCFIGGNNNGTEDVLIIWSYTNEGTSPLDKQTLATANQIAATWGLAYEKKERKIYSAAVLKRHVGLHYEPDGRGGLGAIYEIDPFTGTPNGSLWLDLNADLGIDVGSIGDNTARGLDVIPNNDTEAYAKAATVGIGDIGLSEDGRTMYIMNLFDKTLYEVDIATKTLVGSYPVPDPNCESGTYRPWAVKYHEGNVYVGVVCDGSLAGKDAAASDALTNTTGRSDLSASVYKLAGGSFTSVLDFPLDYIREPNDQYNGNCNVVDGWFPWITDNSLPPPCAAFGPNNVITYSQPILSDIEFTETGDMVLGFMDRMGLQIGSANYGPTGATLYETSVAGDILHACSDGVGSFDIESVDCANSDGHYLNSDSGNYDAHPDGHGEYYGGDFFQNNGTFELPGDTPGHPEITLGGLGILPGSGEVVASAYDPVTGGNNFATGGVIRLSTTTGQRTANGFQLYASADPLTFGKGIGIGDVEIVCDPTPIQLGNYVWLDEDEDGVQDACEPPVEGLPVTLYTKDDDGTLTAVATTTTGPNGEYYFTGDGTAGETWTNSGEAILSDTTYLIVFGDTPTSDTTFTYNNVEYAVTQDSTGEGNNPGLNDSDAVFTDVNGNSLPAICYTTADSTDHTLDVGLIPSATFDLALTKTLDLSANPGPFSPGSTVDFNITVYNQGDVDATDIEVKDYVPAGLSLAPASAPDWTISVDTAILTTPFSLAAGMDSVLSISFVIDADFMLDTLVNRAEISNFDDDGDPLTDPPVDEDSTPNDNGDDPAEADTPDEIDDDGDGTPGTMDDPNDEDDYDWEGIPIVQSFDLNLVKQVDSVATMLPLTYGSEVTYIIEVRNQGSLDAADVEVADYIPEGLTLVTDANWTLDVDTARTTSTYAIAAGDTLRLSISFTIALDFAGTEIINTAEIAAAMNALGLPDEDSTPGDNGGDDPEVDTDDEDDDDGPNGNGTPDRPEDSDDFDLARISIETVSLGSTVFVDNNNDGLLNGADTGIEGVEVQLWDATTMMQVFTDASGARVLTAGEAAPTLTDAEGKYHFTNLLPGDYYVVIPTAPTEVPISSNDAGIPFVETDPDDNQDNDDDGLQPDGAGMSVTSDTITLSLGDEPEDGANAGAEEGLGAMQDDAFDSNGNMTVDFGFFAPVSLGDTTFVDLDGDGLQGPDDAPLGNVTVTVYDNATGLPVTLDAGGMAYTATQTTAADGSYLFENLPPGDYYVEFDLSTADNGLFYDYTTPNAGDDADDSDAVPAAPEDDVASSAPTGFLASGGSDLSLDAGVQCAITVTVADPFTICATATIDLTQDASITPASLGGTWSTPDGSLSAFTTGTDFATATTYVPTAEDARRGSVTLILTSNDPDGPCEPVSAQVTIEILKVDCGSFPWGGN